MRKYSNPVVRSEFNVRPRPTETPPWGGSQSSSIVFVSCSAHQCPVSQSSDGMAGAAFALLISGRERVVAISKQMVNLWDMGRFLVVDLSLIVYESDCDGFRG
jgi:hypothetical protein